MRKTPVSLTRILLNIVLIRLWGAAGEGIEVVPSSSWKEYEEEL